MTQTVSPATYHGEITAPPSKSYLQRAIAIAALAQEPTTIHYYAPNADADAAIRIVKTLGAQVEISGTQLHVIPGETQASEITLDCGEAGLSTRMFSPIAACFDRTTHITGHGSIMKRPMGMITDALTQLNCRVSSSHGFLPLIINGRMTSGNIDIDGSESSQLLTGLLIALPLLDGESCITVHNLKSIPYVQMTLDILDAFGVAIKHDNFHTFTIKGNQRPKGTSYAVEGDWSGATFHLVGAAVSGEATVKGLSPHSAQADKAVLQALESCGATVSTEANSITVQKNELRAFEFDATHCPDLFPPLAALAACCEGETRIIGTERLTSKESNRALTIQEEFGKLGIDVRLDGNCMKIRGGIIQGGEVSSRNDHRIAMATAILGIRAEGAVTIHQAEAIQKSYPEFFNDLTTITT